MRFTRQYIQVERKEEARERGRGDILAAAWGGTIGTGGASAAACSFAFTDSWESEAWRKRIRLKRRVMGVCSCTGGEGGRFSSLMSTLASRDGVCGARSLDEGRPPS